MTGLSLPLRWWSFPGRLLFHYCIHTERTYTDWIKRYIHFHYMRSREDLAGGESKIELFLTDLAVNGKVSPSTQNQAMNALVFLE